MPLILAYPFESRRGPMRTGYSRTRIVQRGMRVFHIREPRILRKKISAQSRRMSLRLIYHYRIRLASCATMRSESILRRLF